MISCYNILALQHQPFDDDGVPVSQTGVIGVVALLCRLVPSLPRPKLIYFVEKKFSFQESQNQGLNRFSSGDTAVFFLKQISLLGNLNGHLRVNNNYIFLKTKIILDFFDNHTVDCH